MAARVSVDATDAVAQQVELLESVAGPDLLRGMIKVFAEALMSAQADAVCGAEYGTRSAERVNSRNGYRAREWDTRVGTIEVAIPKLRSGARRAGRAARPRSGPGVAVPGRARRPRPRRPARTGRGSPPAAPGRGPGGRRARGSPCTPRPPRKRSQTAPPRRSRGSSPAPHPLCE
jgi:hypothetical protein